MRKYYKNLKEILLFPALITPWGLIWGLFLMWLFLFKIKRTDLFIDVISSSNILIFLAATCVWFLFCLTFIIFVPSFYFHLGFHGFQNNKSNNSKIGLKILYRSIFVACILIILIYANAFFESYQISHFSLIAIIMVLSFMLSFRINGKFKCENIKPQHKKNLKIGFFEKLKVSTTIFLSSSSVVFPTGFLLHSFDTNEESIGVPILMIAGLSTFLSFIAYSPIYFYLKTQSDKKNSFLSLIILPMIIFSVLFGLLLFTNTFLKIFKAPYLLNDQSYYIYLKNDILPFDLMNKEIWEVDFNHSKNKNWYQIKGERILNLSDKTLICPVGTYDRWKKNLTINVYYFGFKRQVSNKDLYAATEMCIFVNNNSTHFRVEKEE